MPSPIPALPPSLPTYPTPHNSRDLLLSLSATLVPPRRSKEEEKHFVVTRKNHISSSQSARHHRHRQILDSFTLIPCFDLSFTSPFLQGTQRPLNCALSLLLPLSPTSLSRVLLFSYGVSTLPYLRFSFCWPNLQLRLCIGTEFRFRVKGLEVHRCRGTGLEWRGEGIPRSRCVGARFSKF